MAELKAAIMGVGMVTAVGMSAKQTAASARAGLSRFSETSIHNKRFEPVVMALLPDETLPALSPKLGEVVGLTSRQMRMLRLATPALQEAVENVPNSEAIPLYLGAPNGLPNRPNPVDEKFLEYLAIQSEINFDVKRSKVFPNGRAAGLLALKAAMEQLASGANRFVIAGGMDTYLDLYLLGTLDMENRVLGNGIMDGFIPGEGAGFIVLTTLDVIKKRQRQSLVGIKSVSTGFEEGHLYSDKPYQGEGLSSAFLNFFEENKMDGLVQEVYISMNGENHWAKEWGVAFMRTHSFFNSEHGMYHPADCFGDTGAASGIILAGLAVIGIKQGYRRSPCLITCSSDFGERAVTVVIAQ
jgi:3-oxoacyl-[acyl-carrier-protein] synthase-1